VDRFLRGSQERDFVARDLAWRASFTSGAALSLVKGAKPETVSDVLEAVSRAVPAGSRFPRWKDQWGFLYLRSYLEQVILKKVDRSTMRFGVEARSPLLDRRVVEYAMSIPAKHRQNLVSSKMPIDYCIRRVLGQPTTRSKKHGMGIPLVSLLKGPLRGDLDSLADFEFLEHQGVFHPQAVSGLVNSFANSPHEHVREIWSVLVFQAWWKNQELKSSRHGPRLET
jgi:hypothetical protein